MKKVRMLGLLLLAVFAVGALTAGTASAAGFQPEWGFCNKVESAGKYTDPGCVTAAKHPKGVYQGSYEWTPFTQEPIDGLNPVLGENGVFKLEVADGRTIECSGLAGSWRFEIPGGTRDATPLLELQGCESEGQPCNTPSTGGVAGEMSNALEWSEEEFAWTTHYGLIEKGSYPVVGMALRESNPAKRSFRRLCVTGRWGPSASVKKRRASTTRWWGSSRRSTEWRGTTRSATASLHLVCRRPGCRKCTS